MHPALLYLRNAIIGALLGLAATYVGTFAYSCISLPHETVYVTLQAAVVFSMVCALIGVPIGIVIALLLTRRAISRANQNAATPAAPADDRPE